MHGGNDHQFANRWGAQGGGGARDTSSYKLEILAEYETLGS